MQNTEISFVDVKELYDAAYDELAAQKMETLKYYKLMAEAEKMANAYRAQLLETQTTRYMKAA